MQTSVKNTIEIKLNINIKLCVNKKKFLVA